VFYLTSAATGVESLSGLTQFIVRGWIEGRLCTPLSMGLARDAARNRQGAA
jgi:hypothetical protein